MSVHMHTSQENYVYLIHVLACYHLVYVYVCLVTHKDADDLHLVVKCDGMGKNIDYQYGERFVSLWTSMYTKIPKICLRRMCMQACMSV